MSRVSSSDSPVYSDPSSDRCMQALASCMDDPNFKITSEITVKNGRGLCETSTRDRFVSDSEMSLPNWMLKSIQNIEMPIGKAQGNTREQTGAIKMQICYLVHPPHPLCSSPESMGSTVVVSTSNPSNTVETLREGRGRLRKQEGMQ